MSRTKTLTAYSVVNIGKVDVTVITVEEGNRITLAQVPKPGGKISRHTGSPDMSLIMSLDNYQGHAEPVWIAAVESYGWQYEVLFPSIQAVVEAVSTSKTYQALLQRGKLMREIEQAHMRVREAQEEVAKLEAGLATVAVDAQPTIT